MVLWKLWIDLIIFQHNALEFCGRQSVDVWNGKDWGCGCHAMHNRRSNVTFQHYMKLSVPNGDVVMIKSFSSNKFSKLYRSANLSPNLLLADLQYTDDFFVIDVKHWWCRILYSYQWWVYKYWTWSYLW